MITGNLPLRLIGVTSKPGTRLLQSAWNENSIWARPLEMAALLVVESRATRGRSINLRNAARVAEISLSDNSAAAATRLAAKINEKIHPRQGKRRNIVVMASIRRGFRRNRD